MLTFHAANPKNYFGWRLAVGMSIAKIFLIILSYRKVLTQHPIEKLFEFESIIFTTRSCDMRNALLVKYTQTIIEFLIFQNTNRFWKYDYFQSEMYMSIY